MNQDLELKLQAWLDGELSAADARRIGREIAGDAEAARLVTELQAIKSTLAGNEMALSVPESREFYWSKIQRQIEREAAVTREPAVPRAGWRNWLSPFAGLTALACLTLLAVRSFEPSAFDEISSTGEGMEAVTFHDQSAGMTVVWLADTEQSQPAQAVESKAQQDTADPEVEME